MSGKMFGQIVLLIIIAAVVFSLMGTLKRCLYSKRLIKARVHQMQPMPK
jgi:hypothetical protein